MTALAIEVRAKLAGQLTLRWSKIATDGGFQRELKMINVDVHRDLRNTL